MALLECQGRRKTCSSHLCSPHNGPLLFTSQNLKTLAKSSQPKEGLALLLLHARAIVVGVAGQCRHCLLYKSSCWKTDAWPGSLFPTARLEEASSVCDVCDMEQERSSEHVWRGYACICALSCPGIVCLILAGRWKQGGCQIREAASRGGDREGCACLLACLAEFGWGLLAGVGRDPGSRDIPQRKLVKCPRNVAVGMLQGRGRACGVWIGGWGSKQADLKGGVSARRLDGHFGRCLGYFSVILCGFDVGFWSNQKPKQQQFTKFDYEVG